MSTRQRNTDESGPRRAARRIVMSGRVQGVGYRPFIYRTAVGFGLNGWVRNGPGRVVIHIEGDPGDVARFESALIESAPPLADPRLELSHAAIVEGARLFRIETSDVAEVPDVCLPPDLFCCDDCLAEIGDASERRFEYPFTNCTQCGPRYTIIEKLPYDRPNTSMAGFALCARCREEYDNPLDRRFHAQPIACPDCGPSLSFDREGVAVRGDRACLDAAIACLREGGIVAVKGIGGYHLLCDASNDVAVARLRARKRRPDKPLAVMFPQIGVDGLDAVREHAVLTEAEQGAIIDPARPIVLVRRQMPSSLSPSLAPGLAELGVFLPYSPLHHLLLAELGAPLVATSGNVSGEPVITDNAEASLRLTPVADAFLHHDRPIVRPADDPVMRVIAGRPRALRVGRGMAPLELELAHELGEPTLAVGGHMKSAIALGWGRRAVVSPHIGELSSPRSLRIFEQSIADLQSLYGVGARSIVCDAHEGYASARWAAAQGLPVTRVQHHAAHASALAGEHPEIERWLVFTWDGVGAGDDGELWGGEALAGAAGAWRRVASLRPFHLLGRDRVGREPWRSAAALMWETGRPWRGPLEAAELGMQAWQRRLGTVRSSAAGRLFDAAASLILGVHVTSFEAQGPMMLESIASPHADAEALPLERDSAGVWRADWEPLLPTLCDRTLTEELRAGIFHERLARTVLAQTLALAEQVRPQAVGLTGGVFQNRLLAERVVALLGGVGIEAHLPEIVPANDGGLAFGQLVEVLNRGSRERFGA